MIMASIYQVSSFFLLFLYNSDIVISHHLCDPKEKIALLEFNKAFSLNESASSSCSQQSYPKTATWNPTEDCCSWDGVKCDEEGEGHVVGLDISCSWLEGTLHPNSSLFALSYLRSLNLSRNFFLLSPFSPQFGTFKNLRVLDLSSSFFLGDVPLEISQLSNLVSLDLSENLLIFSNVVMNQLVKNLTNLRDFALDNIYLSSINPSSLMNFSISLASLRLSSSGLSGNFPDHIFSFPNLRVLQLDYNYGLKGNLPMSNWSQSLEILSLVSTNFSGEIPNSIGNAKSLKYLNFSSCKFTGKIPESIGNLTQLNTIDLFANKFIGGIPESIGNLKQLNTIDLSVNKFNGQLPNAWNNLQKLTNFKIHMNSFMGQLPDSLFNLTQLSSLTTSYNLFSGPLTTNVSADRLSNLVHLNLESNSLIGVIPSWLFSLPHLNFLDLSDNHFTGFVKDFRFNSLEFLDLSKNNLQGGIFESIYRQVNLTSLALGSNNFSGVLNLDMLLRIQSLKSLDISNNHQLSIHSTNVSSKNLVHVEMGSHKLAKFPYFLRYQKNLNYLDLSDSKIQGEIPKWFSELGGLNHINLSHNFLSSGMDVLLTLPNLTNIYLDFNLFKFPPILPPSLNQFTASNNQLSGNIHPSICQATKLDFLDLSNNCLSGAIPSCLFNMTFLMLLELKRNNFSGPVPIPPPWMLIYTASENQFSGEIPSSICQATFLAVLSLSNNRLSGAIPPCLANLTSLLVLDLKKNNFSGTIPTNFPTGSQLRSIDLNDNQIEGELPRSLLNCENLTVLDLGNNKITGYFPHWLEAASSLRVLILRSNRFYGHINNSMNRYSFQNLRIIDLSRNHFTGPLPSNLFINLRAMIMKEVEVGNQKPNSSIESDILPYYQDSVVVSLKGLELKLERILLIFKAIDLSRNDFNGEIPKSIGMLMSLKGLNLSHNKLTGGIPTSFENLNNLEWLDLSTNRLFGNIPPQLATLTFLSFLNLSQNQLSGVIPQGKQFATFESSSYIGNIGLCGFPLPNCDSKKDHDSQVLDEEDDIFGKGFWWRVVFMGYGCGIVFGIFVGYAVFRIGKPLWIVAMVEGKRGSKRSQRPKRRNCWPKKRND